MTQYIYIASPIKLPQGSIGANPVSQEKPMIFKTELDAVHLLFENNYDADQKRKFPIARTFPSNME